MTHRDESWVHYQPDGRLLAHQLRCHGVDEERHIVSDDHDYARVVLVKDPDKRLTRGPDCGHRAVLKRPFGQRVRRIGAGIVIREVLVPRQDLKTA